MTRLKADADLELVRAFMNTLDGGVDHIADPDAFGAWLVANGLVSDRGASDQQELVLARRLRGALRRLARSNQEAPVDPDAIDELNDVAAEVGLRARFTAGAEVELTSSAAGARGALNALVAAVAVAIADGSWPRVKVCDNDECAVVFYDSSRNRSGRWCTMAVCGNRIKARTFRERHNRAREPEQRTDSDHLRG